MLTRLVTVATKASMAGAIGVACWGKACIPSEWVDGVGSAGHAVKTSRDDTH